VPDPMFWMFLRSLLSTFTNFFCAVAMFSRLKGDSSSATDPALVMISNIRDCLRLLISIDVSRSMWPVFMRAKGFHPLMHVVQIP